MESILVKRGRPKKLSEESKALALKKYLNDREEKEKSLAGLQLRYLQEDFSDKVQQVLRKMPVMASLPYSLQILPLVNLFEEAAKQLMMNETELTAVSCILNKISDVEIEIVPEEFVFVVFFAAKIQMENDQELIKRLYEKMNSQIKGFEKCLSTVLQAATVSVSDLIKEYSRFESKMETVNYLYYVDDILRVCTPYQTNGSCLTKKKSKKVNKHKKMNEYREYKRFGRENKSKANPDHMNHKLEDKNETKAHLMSFKVLMPIKKIENDGLNLEEVLDQGMRDYLKFDINNFLNDDSIENEGFDLCDEFFQDFTV